MTVKGYKEITKEEIVKNGWFTYPYVIEESRTGIEFTKTIERSMSAWFPEKTIIVEVEILGETQLHHSGCFTFTNKLKVIREIPPIEVYKTINDGFFNTGSGNRGRGNTGDNNVGYSNAGDMNIGHQNTGEYNIGDCNTGMGNVGDFNNGSFNIGHANTGDFNKGNGCFGFLNTFKRGGNIYLFNQLTDLTMADFEKTKAYGVLHTMPKFPVEWIPFSEMTEEEKENHPASEKLDGFLKKTNLEKKRQEWWDSLKQKDKNAILSIPNFNATIFKEITGIDVGDAIEYTIIKNPDKTQEVFFYCGRIESHTVLDACEKFCPRYSSCDTVAEMNDILRDYELNK